LSRVGITAVGSRGIESDLAFLRRSEAPEPITSSGDAISIVDIFSGCGGLTIGAIEGAARAGRHASLTLAVDNDERPLSVLRSTLKATSDTAVAADLDSILGRFSEASQESEMALLEKGRGVSLLLAGPPCQGHSALNNHTRHDDPRNDLYVAVARAARLLEPSAVIIENVRGVVADRRRSVERCASFLEELGYEVVQDRVDLTRTGAPQRRVRHVLVATRTRLEWAWPEPEERGVGWAIEDLLDVPPIDMLDTPSQPTGANRRRIEWLFENNAHNLPNPERPLCHRDDHSYLSMYGRLWWEKPAQTITSGFGCMGQGRFVHPLRPRTLTPHEAARLQFLPDFLDVSRIERRRVLAKLIGNAAPPSLTISLVQTLCEQGLL
jgi:DNA (cytosine-5)-methyltransferase 1